jgi:nitrite reductase (NADH) small subunit
MTNFEKSLSWPRDASSKGTTTMIATTTLGSFVVNLGPLTKIPRGEGRLFRVGEQSIAVFHTRDANVFATEPTCPHKGGPLADGMVGAQKVICPLHNFVFDLSNGQPIGNSCRTLKTYPTMINDEGDILVGIEELLAVS